MHADKNLRNFALQEELRVAIARAANQGEDYLIELSNQICMCLQVRHSSINTVRHTLWSIILKCKSPLDISMEF